MQKLALSIVMVGLPIAVFGQLDGPIVPETMSFHGVLADGSGVVVPDGNYNLLFKLYDGGTSIWQENHIGVPVESGVFGVILGGNGSTLANVPFGELLELGVTVNGGNELTPRTPLTSGAYALGVRGLYVTAAQNASGSGPNLIAGAAINHIATGVIGGTISGGGGVLNGLSAPDSVLGDWGTIGGGSSNVVGEFSTVGGGLDNSSRSAYGTVAGGGDNDVRADFGTIGGGLANDANAEYATVGGGIDNDVVAARGTIGGGSGNFVQAIGGTVPGGKSNLVAGEYAFAAGSAAGAIHDGTFVWSDAQSISFTDPFQSTAANQFLVQAGGGVGVNTASPDREMTIFDMDDSGDSVINITSSNPKPRELLIGVNQSTGGIISMQTDNDLDFRTNGNSRLKIESGGQIAIERSSASHPLHVGNNSSTGNGAHVTAGGAWTNGSSRAFKRDFSDVDVLDILDRLAGLEVTTWFYTNPEEGRHMGPVAEDFSEAFGLGSDERYISTTDADGVSMAAIQGLYKLVTELQAVVEAQRNEIERLSALHDSR